MDILGIDLGSCISRNEKTGSLGKGRKVSLPLDKTTSETPPPKGQGTCLVCGSLTMGAGWTLVSTWESQPPQHCRVGPEQGWGRTSDYSWTLVSVFAPSYVLWDHSTMGWIMVLNLALSIFKDHGSLHWAFRSWLVTPTISCSWMCFLCAWFQC